MKKMLMTLYSKLRGFFPCALPTGQTEFDQFCESIFTLYQLPAMNSYREAIATMIMHLGPTTSTKAPYFFAKSIRKAQANQVAYSVIQDCKKKYIDEERAKQALEATTEAKIAQ